MVAPIVNGVVQMFGSSTLGEQLLSVTSPDSVFGIAFGGITAMAALALIGTVAAVAIARRPAGILAAAVGVLTLAMFLPGMLSLAASVTGAGAVVWRLPIVAPTGVLVGLLAAAPVERWSTRFGGVAARAGMAAVALVVAVVVAVPVLSGRWQWSTEVGAKLTSSPTWKVDPVALADVRAARRLHVAPGLWLMPRVQMENLAISTAGPYAVVPRIAYLPALDESKQQLRDRRVLFVLARGAPLTLPSVADVRGALRRLDVALACVPGDAPGARRLLSQAVGGHLQRVGSMECHVAAP
jgi:hypothetical protein